MVGQLVIVLALWPTQPASLQSCIAATPNPSGAQALGLTLAGHRFEVPFAQDPAPAPPQPEDQQATVDAHVKLRDGKPAEGARIAGKGPAGAKVEAFADAGGKFQIKGPPGAYALDIRAGDQRGRFTATLRDGRLTPAEFILR